VVPPAVRRVRLARASERGFVDGDRSGSYLKASYTIVVSRTFGFVGPVFFHEVGHAIDFSLSRGRMSDVAGRYDVTIANFPSSTPSSTLDCASRPQEGFALLLESGPLGIATWAQLHTEGCFSDHLNGAVQAFVTDHVHGDRLASLVEVGPEPAALEMVLPPGWQVEHLDTGVEGALEVRMASPEEERVLLLDPDGSTCAYDVSWEGGGREPLSRSLRSGGVLAPSSGPVVQAVYWGRIDERQRWGVGVLASETGAPPHRLLYSQCSVDTLSPNGLGRVVKWKDQWVWAAVREGRLVLVGVLEDLAPDAAGEVILPPVEKAMPQRFACEGA